MIFRKPILLLLLIICACAPSKSKTEKQKQKQTQQAQWLTISNFEHAPNQWYHLRKSFELNENQEKATIKIAVDSKYWLWVNGKMVVYEGQLKRGPNANDTYYDELDLSGYFKKGKNTIAVLAWYFGRDGFSHNDSKKFGFFFDAKIGTEHIISDASWKIKKSKAYQDIKEGKQANFRLSEGHVSYVASEEIENWQALSFNDANWETPMEVGVEGAAPWNNLVKRPIPQWKDFGLTKATNLTREGNRVVMKFPYNLQFSYWIKVKASKGQTINITTDNFETLNHTPIRSRYVTKEGVQEYEHFPWMSGHALYFDLDEGVELLEAGYRQTGYDSEMDGKFVVNDPYMMRLLEKANRTLYINMRDTYFDCPDRERAQWWGDIVLLMEESFYVMDNNTNKLSRKAVRELVDWQKDDGILFSPIPAGNWDSELPQQMLAAVGLGFRNYYKYTGDLETYKYAYPNVKKYLDLWIVDDNGHVNFKEGGWDWSDWGEQIDAELLEQAWYYIALQTYADMAEKMGETTEKVRVLNLAAKIKKFVNENYWTKDGYRSADYKEEIDDRGNGMMVVVGIAEEDKYETIATLLKNIRHSSPYMDKYELEALFIMGKNEQALERMKTRYKTMVDSELTTLWELFTEGNWSNNHGWSGGPLSMMYKYMAGIQPTKPGFEQFQVFPEPIGYKDISCSISTVKGKITLNYTNKDGEIGMNVLVPEASEAIIRIPIGKENVNFTGEGEYKLMKASAQNDYNYYTISSGEWLIRY